MAMQGGRKIYSEKGYEKYAWILLFVVGIFGFIFGIRFMTGIGPDPEYFNRITGMSWDQFIASKQAMALYVMDSLRVTGILLLGIGIIAVAISATAFRKGERWAWYVCGIFRLTLPRLCGYSTHIIRTPGPSRCIYSSWRFPCRDAYCPAGSSLSITATGIQLRSDLWRPSWRTTDDTLEENERSADRRN